MINAVEVKNISKKYGQVEKLNQTQNLND